MAFAPSYRQSILNALRACAHDEQVLVIHSSLPHLQPPAGVTKWDFLYALRVLIEEGRTIALPAFTFSWCGGTPYHHISSASEVGVLADWAMVLNEFQRTPHPIYSYVVAGPRAEDIMASPNSTTFGPDSQLAAFERIGARVIMLGCDWRSCTQFHCYEEEANVPYRYFKTFVGQADFGMGADDVRADMFVRDYAVSEDNEFGQAVEMLSARQSIETVGLWNGRVESARCCDIAAVCRELLADDPLSLIANPTVVSHKLRERNRAKREKPLRVAILGASNVAFLQSALDQSLTEYVTDQRIELYHPPFGQAGREIADPGSGLFTFDPDYVFFVDRLEDLLGVSSIALTDSAAVHGAVNVYLKQIKKLREQSGAHIVVNRFVQMSASALGHADHGDDRGVAAMVRAMNDSLDEALGQLTGVSLFDLATAATRYDGPPLDARMWFMGRFPFSDGFSRQLARQYCALVLALSGRTVRLLVLDLDNTLWGGVLGEDGKAGLQLGGDFPGNAYKAFQELLLRYRERGVALAVCSKNDEDLAFDAIASLPDMKIRPEHLSAYRINWRMKWKNLEEICEDLNLGHHSVMFIDDNPAERELMRRNLPGVRVLDLPSDPALYAQALVDTPWMECVELTSEDRQRAESYRVRAQTRRYRDAFDNIDDYYASLETCLHISPLNEVNLARTVQLINKTNQFNTTTRRYDRHDLEVMVKRGVSVYVIGAEDRFNSLENIGVLIVDWDRPRLETGEKLAVVLSYLLSCRILGRGIETAALYWLIEKARSRNRDAVIGEVIETDRNTPARSVFQDAGFHQSEQDGEWVFRTDASRGLASWMRIVDNTEEDGR
ncbi:MAG: HAD-IIIC family phosphatase [Alphaproteobacteria bacterium]|nr:HAD-IIIC family phosphatase [Alphaproteobacteria bacterium]